MSTKQSNSFLVSQKTPRSNRKARKSEPKNASSINMLISNTNTISLTSKPDPGDDKPSFRQTRATARDNNIVVVVDDDDEADIITWNQTFPGAERVPGTSPFLDVEGGTVLSDEDRNGPAMLPRIIEATAVDDDEQERLREENRRLHEERQQYMQQTETRPPLVYATTASNVQDRDIPENSNKSDNERTLWLGWFVCQTKRISIFMGCILIVVIVSVSVVMVVKPKPTPVPTSDPTSPTPDPTSPTPDPTLQGTSNPSQVTLNDCQIQAGCQTITGIPVTANGDELKRVIKEYLNDPSSSLHGSNINCWDVSQVTDMSFAFSWFTFSHDSYDSELDDPLFQTFDEPINCWDVSKVTNMRSMFDGPRAWYGPWDASSVTEMSGMAFNQDIGRWDVSSVTDMAWMFSSGIVFNQDIGFWDVSRVKNTTGMFWYARSFNQDIGLWNVSSVIDMSWMFENATAFSQDLGSWDVSSVTRMSYMFYDAQSFYQNLCPWREKVDLSKVDVAEMFDGSGCDDPTTPTSTSSNWCQVCTV